MRIRKLGPLPFLIFAIAFFAAVLTGCDKAKVTAPTVTGVELQKAVNGYSESKEYLYNKGRGNPMAVSGGEDIIVSVKFKNPGNYAVSYIKIDDGKEKRQYMSSDFESGSSKKRVLLRIKTPEADPGTEFSYKILSVFYNTGRETLKTRFAEGAADAFSIKISPSYKLRLNYQNADRRMGADPKKSTDVVSDPVDIPFNAKMSEFGVDDKDYGKPKGLPEKPGGWVFEGWFTEPLGGGVSVAGDDKFFFWEDVTLYAHFTRIFKCEIVDLPVPVTHEYDKATKADDGKPSLVTASHVFNKGVVITEEDTRGAYPEMQIDDTLSVENPELRPDGGVDWHAEEYPVVKIGQEAFKDVNTIKSLRLGKYIESLEYGCFNNCNKLTEVFFNKGSRLKYIGDYAFFNTKDLRTLTIPDAVTYLGNFAFKKSGWNITSDGGVSESVLHIYPRYSFIGADCFFGTKFQEVVFEPGTHYEGQIPYNDCGSTAATDGITRESLVANGGWRDIRPDENRIGANLFANCPDLVRVKFETNEESGADALNIIPDRAFDAYNYSVEGLEFLSFGEGIKEIGDMAFSYQKKLPDLHIPASVEKIGRYAFDNCCSVSELTFGGESALKELRSYAFRNLIGISYVVIRSDQTETLKFGNGPFAGCNRLKGIEFPDVKIEDRVPEGYSEEEEPGEVPAKHYYSDFLFGTFESGKEKSAEDEGEEESSYSTPTAVFCQTNVQDKFRNNLLDGKELYTTVNVNGKSTRQSTGRDIYRDKVFVYDMELVKDWEFYEPAKTEPTKVKIVLQPIKKAGNGDTIGYSLVSWSERNSTIKLPKSSELDVSYEITEIAMYALPTSVRKVIIPGTYKRIEHDAFNGCTQLAEIEFPEGNNIEYIGNNAFLRTALRHFEAGDKLKVIGKTAFYGCKNLIWVDLSKAAITNPPDVNGDSRRKQGLQQYKYSYEKDAKDPWDWKDALYDGAFQNCKSLSWVYLPTGLRQINNALFSGCESLRHVAIPTEDVPTSNKTTDDDAFYANASPTAVYNEKAFSRMCVYVPDDEKQTHKELFPSIDDERYKSLSDMPRRPE